MKKTLTLKQLMAAVSAVLLLFLILTVVVLFSTSRNITNRHIHAVGAATLNYYQTQLDATLDRAASSCQAMVFNSITAMEQADNTVERYQRKLELGRTLSSLLYLSDNLYFTMAVPSMGASSGTVIRSRCSSMTHCQAIQDYLTELVRLDDPLTTSDRWTWLEVDGAYYLTRFFRNKGAFCVICVANSVLSVSPDNEDNLYLFCQQGDDKIAANTAVQQALAEEPDNSGELQVGGLSYSILSTNSLQGDFSIQCLVTSATSDLSGYLVRQGMMLLLFFLVMLLCLFWLLRYITRAFSTLNQACVQVSQGDLNTSITLEGRFTEERQIYSAFNDMIQQIKELRIDLYEQALHAQRSKLGFLRTQIKSHFFVNCLTVMHSLAMVGNTALIQEFALCLADYFRYLGSGFSPTVRFGSELEHLHNFVKIHQIRYPGRITYQYSVEPELTDFNLLPMIPQTFAENVFKHALGAVEQITLTVRAYAGSWQERNGMWLEIEDNGPGFTPEQLQVLNQPWDGEEVPIGSGTGIHNTKERLYLFYHGHSTIEFTNRSDHGAIVRVFFPEKETEEPT